MECPTQLIQRYLGGKPQVQIRLLRRHPLPLQRRSVYEDITTTAIARRGDHFKGSVPQDTTVTGASKDGEGVRHHRLTASARGVSSQGQRPPHLHKATPIPPEQAKQRKHGGKGTLGNPTHGAAREPQVQVQPKLHTLSSGLSDGDGATLRSEQHNREAEWTTARTRMVGDRIHAPQPVFTPIEGRQHPQGTFIPPVAPFGERTTAIIAPLELRHEHVNIHPAGFTVPDRGGLIKRSGKPLTHRPAWDHLPRT